MRLKADTIRTITLTDGQKVEVRGQDLRQPPWQEMDRFERDYWTRKPDSVLINKSLNHGGCSAEQLEDAILRAKSEETQRWVNDTHDGCQKRVFSGFAPWNMVDENGILRNKGQSSVAVQSVHALSKTPSRFDGAADFMGRKIQGAASQGFAPNDSGAAPTKVQNYGADRDMWVGPFRRGMFQPAEEDEELIRSYNPTRTHC